jgi:hypothetical protein
MGDGCSQPSPATAAAETPRPFSFAKDQCGVRLTIRSVAGGVSGLAAAT